MDTSSPHGHPTTRRLSDPPSHQQLSAHRRQPYSPPAFTPSPQHEARVNPHQRRLQLRNSAFGTQLSAQRLGARFTSIFHGNEEPQSLPARDRHQENRTPHRGSLRSTRSTYSLTSSLGILNEISNSSHIPSLRKRASIPIYEDNPERPLLERSPATPDSQYHDASSTVQSPLSPLGLSYIQEDTGIMRLRELSGNERRRSPSLSSPLISVPSKGRRRMTGMRKSSVEAAEYIDHIEKQLEQVKQAMHSPKSGKPIHDKMRILKADNGRLQKTIDELEASFETRVKSSVEHMTAGEGELRRRVRSLENDVRERDLRIEELEYDRDQIRLDQCTMETLKATIERLEGEKQTLEDANNSVEKRNEALTEMLAFSPTKSQSGFELASPVRNRGRLPRPVSMMSWTRFPSSPASKHASRPSSMVNSPTAMSQGGYFSPDNILELELEHACNDADSGLGESCSAKSPVASSSRRSTIASQSATSPSAWGLPLPVAPGEGGETIRPIQKRKPRRFMTGSTQLKPLLLPSMAAESAGLTSPRSSTRDEMQDFPHSIDQTMFLHDLEGSLTSPKREVSQESIDPTTSYLSNPFGDANLNEGAESGSSPPQVAGLRGLSAASIEGTSLAVELDDTSFLNDGFVMDIDDETGVEEDEDATCLVGSPERRTLFSPEESRRPYPAFDESPPVERIRSSPATQDKLMSSIQALMHTPSDDDESIDTSPNPRKRRKTSSWSHSDAPVFLKPSIGLFSDSAKVSNVRPSDLKPPDSDAEEDLQLPGPGSIQYHPEVNPVTLAARAANQRTSSPPSSKRLSRSTTPLDILKRRSASSSPLAAVTIRSIYGNLSRYTTYIREFKRDPLALARRVIANAWCSNWKRFGKLSWWVLGIFLPGGQNNLAETTGWDWDHYDGEAVANQFCRSHAQADQVPDPSPQSSPSKRSVRFEDQHESYRTQGSKIRAKPVLKGSQEKQAGLGKSLYLWGKFSVAIMLAVGGAVLKGPGEMLKDCDMRAQVEATPRKSTSTRHHDDRGISRDRSLRGFPDLDEEILPQVLPRRPRIFSLGTNFDFAKTGRSPSNVFTFGSPDPDSSWDEEDDDADGELNHYHQPYYGEDCERPEGVAQWIAGSV